MLAAVEIVAVVWERTRPTTLFFACQLHVGQETANFSRSVVVTGGQSRLDDPAAVSTVHSLPSVGEHSEEALCPGAAAFQDVVRGEVGNVERDRISSCSAPTNRSMPVLIAPECRLP